MSSADPRLGMSYSSGDNTSSTPISIPIPRSGRTVVNNNASSSTIASYPRTTPSVATTGSGYLPMGTSVTTEETLASSQSSHSPFRDNTLLQTNSIASNTNTSHLISINDTVSSTVEVLQSPTNPADEMASLRESIARPAYDHTTRDETILGTTERDEPRVSFAHDENLTRRDHYPGHESATENDNDTCTINNDDDNDDADMLTNHEEQLKFIRSHYRTKLNAKSETEEIEEVEEELNIAEFPTDKLLEMLTALLNKIIKSNDQMEPYKDKDKDEDHDDDESLTDSKLMSVKGTDKEKYLKSILSFKGKHVPQITLYQYFQRIQKYCPTTNDVFLSLLVYFDRISKKCNSSDSESADTSPADQLFVMDSYNIHRLVIAGVTVCTKFFSDFFYSNSRYARVGGISLSELNHLELQFLVLCDFELLISVDKLQRYANLLLRFWNNQGVDDSRSDTTVSQD